MELAALVHGEVVPSLRGEMKMDDPIKVYVGFESGSPHRSQHWGYEFADGAPVKALAVFTSLRAAKKCFDDVRVARLVLESESIQ